METAETKAMLLGARLVRWLDINNFSLESECLNVVTAANQGKRTMHYCGSIISDIFKELDGLNYHRFFSCM